MSTGRGMMSIAIYFRRPVLNEYLQNAIKMKYIIHLQKIQHNL